MSDVKKKAKQPKEEKDKVSVCCDYIVQLNVQFSDRSSKHLFYYAQHNGVDLYINYCPFCGEYLKVEGDKKPLVIEKDNLLSRIDFGELRD